MASGNDAGQEGQGGKSRWQEGGSIYIRGIDNPQEIVNWRKLRDPGYFQALKMGNQIFRQLSGISIEVQGKDGQTTFLGKQPSEDETSLGSSHVAGTSTTTGFPKMSMDKDHSVFGDEESADVASNDQKGSFTVHLDEIDQLRSNLDQVTKENELMKGRLNLLTIEVNKGSQENELLKAEQTSSQKEIENLKEKVAGMEEIKAKLVELEEVKEKVKRIEDSTLPPAVERRGRPSKTPEGRTIPCEFCPKMFSFAQSKNLHVQSMHQGKRWYCNYCSQAYSSPAAKYVHVRSCPLRLAGAVALVPSTLRQAETIVGSGGILRRSIRRRRRSVKNVRNGTETAALTMPA